MDKTKPMFSVDDAVGMYLLTMVSAEVIFMTHSDKSIVDIFNDKSCFDDCDDVALERMKEMSKYISPNAPKLFLEVMQDERLKAFIDAMGNNN